MYVDHYNNIMWEWTAVEDQQVTGIIIYESFPFLDAQLGPSAAIGGGLSIFTNEDIEKALGIAATKDLDKAESTQLWSLTDMYRLRSLERRVKYYLGARGM